MIWKIWKKGKLNSEKIRKIWKQESWIVIRFVYFLPYFSIFSLFILLFFHIFHIISQFSSVFSKSFHYSTCLSSIISISLDMENMEERQVE
jgi:hypothetical protein